MQPRYMGGKSLLKFFREDTWPALVDLFERLDVNQARGFEVFKAFASADINEDGMVDIDECFKYIGGRRTKFTERIFYSESSLDENGFPLYGLNFQAFLIAVWGYCTLTPAGVARYIFEIFDVDEQELLEKPDIESMFRMLYHTDEVEEEYIAMYEFEQYTKISKANFCSISAKKTFLIRPALDYQARLRSRTGGKAMWRYLTNHRIYEFKQTEEKEKTLDCAVSDIVVSSKGYSSRNAVLSADERLVASQKKIRFDAEMAERELKLQQRRMESESRSMKATAPDRKMHQAWAILAQQKRLFQEEEYLTTDIEKRNKDRQKLFALFDIAKNESIIYWEYKDQYDLRVTEGSPADHAARYEDHIKTAEGKAVLEITSLIVLFELILTEISDQIAKMKKKPKKKTEKQLLFESQLQELTKIMSGIKDPEISESEYNKRLKFLIERDFTEEHQFAKKYCKKPTIQKAEKIAYDILCSELKERTLSTMRTTIAARQEQRRREYIIKEFDIITNFGSRTTRWEYVLKKDVNRYTYIARDTLELRHPKTAICEQCDAIFVQHELQCIGCNAPRSAKNLKLYRPLGFKDITLE